MFTIVNGTEATGYRRKATEPPLEIISHRGREPNPTTWSERRRDDDITYRQLRQHRDTLLEDDRVNRKRIRDLERERDEFAKIYDEVNQENKTLKSHLKHGPDAVKLKQLKKEARDMKSDIETLTAQNQSLQGELKELMKKDSLARDRYLEHQWQKSMEKTARNKRDKEAIRKAGDIKGAKEDDTYDLHLDTIQKEIQILLNKVRQLKQEKMTIDLALFADKGAVTKNDVVGNALHEKLDKDLATLQANLDHEKKKFGRLSRNVRKHIEENRDPNTMEDYQDNQQPVNEFTTAKDMTGNKKSMTDTEAQTDQTGPGLRKYLATHKSKCTQTINNNHKGTQTDAIQTDTKTTLAEYKAKLTKHAQKYETPNTEGVSERNKNTEDEETRTSPKTIYPSCSVLREINSKKAKRKLQLDYSRRLTKRTDHTSPEYDVKHNQEIITAKEENIKKPKYKSGKATKKKSLSEFKDKMKSDLRKPGVTKNDLATSKLSPVKEKSYSEDDIRKVGLTVLPDLKRTASNSKVNKSQVKNKTLSDHKRQLDLMHTRKNRRPVVVDTLSNEDFLQRNYSWTSVDDVREKHSNALKENKKRPRSLGLYPEARKSNETAYDEVLDDLDEKTNHTKHGKRYRSPTNASPMKWQVSPRATGISKVSTKIQTKEGTKLPTPKELSDNSSLLPVNFISEARTVNEDSFLRIVADTK